jgi:hypothetical protein
METEKKAAPVLSLEDFTSKEDTLRNVFFPSWDNRPPELPAIVKLGGTPILTHQNTGALIANPGAGKSSAMEAIAASYLNPAGDNLGFEVDPECAGVIVVDNERTNTDVWNSFHRICRRAGISEGGQMRNVKMAGLRSVARLPERIKVIENLLDSNPCGLLLLDGAGDLVLDTNDLAQAIECRIWLRELSVKYNISIFATLHPNPNTDKPRGHQGSEICREAECVLLAKAFDGDTKIITSDFEHGKNRNNPKLTTAYCWSDEHKMFVSVDYEDAVASKSTRQDEARRAQVETLAKSVLNGQTSLRHSDLVAAIMDKTSCKESSAKTKVREMKAWGYAIIGPDERYRLGTPL